MKKKRLPEMIDYFRRQNGWTMKEFGEKMDKSESAISKWIKGVRSPMVDDFNKMVTLFGTDPDTLMYGAKEKNTLSKINNIISELPEEQQDQLLELAKYDLDDVTRDTIIMMLKADNNYRDKVFSYAEYEYFKYKKELESKKSRNAAC